MMAWSLAFAGFLCVFAMVALQLRRQRSETGRLVAGVEAMQSVLEQAVHQFAETAPYRGEDILDSIEDDDCEMANNLGRLNLLLDQLNGLLHGGKAAGGYERRMSSGDEEWSIPYPGPVEFESPKELRKFNQLPPISDDDITTTDWDVLFRRLQSDELD